jgi:hypothetical protein
MTNTATASALTLATALATTLPTALTTAPVHPPTYLATATATTTATNTNLAAATVTVTITATATATAIATATTNATTTTTDLVTATATPTTTHPMEEALHKIKIMRVGINKSIQFKILSRKRLLKANKAFLCKARKEKPEMAVQSETKKWQQVEKLEVMARNALANNRNHTISFMGMVLSHSCDQNQVTVER